MLTLASNERIPLKPSMRLIFEISHLRTATPATVSRAGSYLFVIPACNISERMCEKIRVSSAGSLFCVLSNPAWILVISSFLFVGILYINPGDLGWNPQVFSWIKEREHQTERANLILLFDKYVPSCLDALRTR